MKEMQRRMKIRINDLARELEVKSKQILDVLIKVGVTEKKTHSSSVEVDEAEKVRKYFHETSGSSQPPSQRRRRVSPQNRSLQDLQARRCAEGHPGAQGAARGNGRSMCRRLRPRPRRLSISLSRRGLRLPPLAERAPRMVTPESVQQRHSFEPQRPPAAVIPPAPPVRLRPPRLRAAATARSAEHPPAEAPAAVSPSASETVQAPVECHRRGRQLPLPKFRLPKRRLPKPAAPTPAAPADLPRPQPLPHKPPSLRLARPPVPGQPLRRAPHDCAADGTASGVHGSAAAAAACAPAAVSGADGQSHRIAGTWAADLPASPSRSIGGSRRCSRCAWRVRRSHGSRCASAVPSRRTPSDASYPQRSYARRPSSHGWRTSRHGSASRWPAPSRRLVRCCRWSSASGRRSASRCARRRACPPSRPALYGAARQAGRTDEGVHAAAPAFAQQ